MTTVDTTVRVVTGAATGEGTRVILEDTTTGDITEDKVQREPAGLMLDTKQNAALHQEVRPAIIPTVDNILLGKSRESYAD